MLEWVDRIITVLIAFLASAGFWTYLSKHVDRNSAKSKMILGLGHKAVIDEAMIYIKRGNITRGEYEDLHNYLYKPYKGMGGNGSVERIMREVDKLPIVSDS